MPDNTLHRVARQGSRSAVAEALRTCRACYAHSPNVCFHLEIGESPEVPGLLRFVFAVESRERGSEGPLRRKGRLYTPIGAAVPIGEMFLRAGEQLAALGIWAPREVRRVPS